MFVSADATFAQPAPEPPPVQSVAGLFAARAELSDADLYYNIAPRALVYSQPDKTRPYVALSFREEVYVMEREGGWYQVRTRDGAQGYVPEETLSNLWIRVSKSKQTLYVYEGVRMIKELPADLGSNFFADKVRRGGANEPDHWRTPEGVFFVVEKNPRSEYHKALVLNYPNAEDAVRGLKHGLISQPEHDAIIAAQQNYRKPPMKTLLGGWIEIHGDGTGARTNWTQGCIAIQNANLDELWSVVHVGTPVLIEH
jgi:hypothetical protein